MKTKITKKICSLVLLILVFCGVFITAQVMPPVKAADYEYNPDAYGPTFSYSFNLDGSVSIFSVINAADEVVIPSMINGMPVTSIFWAFKGNKNIRKVVLPDTLTSIGINAFYGCENLETVSFSKNLISIDEEAFEQCKCLKKIELPDGLISIEKNAFYGCTELSDIRFPDSLRDVGKDAFSNTKWRIGQPEGNIYAGRVLIEYKGTITTDTVIRVKKGTKAISKEAFYSKNDLMKVILPDTLEYIGDAAFKYCRNFPKIDIPDSVRYIGANAFEGCTSLEEITFPEKLDHIGKCAFSGTAWAKSHRGKELYIGGIYCGGYGYTPNGEKTVILKDGTRGIAEYAFYKNPRIESIIIPGSVKYIGRSAFESCGNLKTVTIKNGTKSIEQAAFKNCTSLESISIPDSVTEMSSEAFCGCTALTKAKLSDGLKILDDDVFNGCTSLKSIVIPDGVEAIGNQAFCKCSSIEGALYIPDSVAFIYYEAFSACKSLTSVRLSPNIMILRTGAFSGCTGLKAIQLPEKITQIEECTFSSCESLERISIPYGVTDIGKYAFSSCINLSEVNIPGSVAKIGSGTFAFCDKLTEITIPDSVTELGEYIFPDSNKPIIKGKAGSAAQFYAEENNIPFVAVDLPLINRSRLHMDKLLLGESVTVSCMAEGGEPEYKYAVFYRKAGTDKWHTVQGFKTNPLVYITPQSAADYEIRVSVKDTAGHTARKDLKLSVRKPLQNRSKLGSESISSGSSVKVRCFAEGGTGGYQYAVYYKKSASEKWAKLRGYDTFNIILLTPKTTSSYDVRVDVKDSSGAVVSKTLSLNVT